MLVPRAARAAAADPPPARVADPGRIAGPPGSLTPGRPSAPSPAAPETQRLYRSDWRAFETWCATRRPGRAAGRARHRRRLPRRQCAHPERRHAGAARRGDRPAAPPARAGRTDRTSRRDDAAAPGAAGRDTPPDPSPRAAQLAQLAARCPRDLAGLRDRALLLLAAAAPGRRGVGHAALLGLTRRAAPLHPRLRRTGAAGRG